MNEELEFRLLGPLEVRRSGERLALGGTKQRTLLAVLLVHLGRALSTDSLYDELWGEHPPATARKTLQTYIWQLRKTLEPDRAADEPPRILVTDGAGYRLAVAPAQVDAYRFEALVDQARLSLDSDDSQAARQALGSALDLWRGPALTDLARNGALAAEAARLEEIRLTAVEERVRADLALGRHFRLIDELRDLVTQHPFRERLWRQLLLALYRAGRQAEALAAYRQARTLLTEELGVEPGAELQRVHKRILAQEPALDWVAPDAETGAESDAEAATGRPAAPHRPQEVFVGRRRELRRLRDRFEHVCAGRSRVMLVSGEPGIGKTRTLRHLQTGVEARGGVMLWGRTHPDLGTPPYWPFAQIIRAGVAASPSAKTALDPNGPLARLLPELTRPGQAAPADAEQRKAAQLQLFESVVAFMRELGATAPTVVVIDDLHWADTSSLLLLRYLAVELVDAHVMLVATYREAEPGAEELLTGTLTDLTRTDRCDIVRLEGLTEDDVSEYLRLATRVPITARLVHSLYDATRGNPFYLTEAVEWLVQEARIGREGTGVPRSLQTAIRHRLQALPDGSGEMLGLAAVVGRDFGLDVLTAVSGHDDDTVLGLVEAALHAGLLEETEEADGYRFSHALVREALLGNLSKSRRLRLHARIGEALEQLYPDGAAERATELAGHYLASAARVTAHASKAVGYSLLAAQQAEAAAGWREAAQHYAAALELLPQVEREDEEAELRLRLGACLRMSGDAAAAGGALLRAFELFDAAGNNRGMGRVALEALHDGVWLDAGQAAALADRALAANVDADQETRARLLARRAWEALGFDETSNRAAVEAAELARELRLLDLQVQILDRETHRAMHEGRFHEAGASARECFDAAHRLRRYEPAAHALTEITGTLLFGGDVDAAMASGTQLIAYADEHKARQWANIGRIMVGGMTFLRGDREGAAALVNEMDPDFFVSPMLFRARQLEVEGDVAGARDLVEQAAGAMPLERLAAFVRGIYLGALARLRWATRDEAATRQATDGWHAALREIPPSLYQIGALGEIDDAATVIGDEETRAWVYEQLCLTDARASMLVHPLDGMRGSLARSLGRPRQARRHFEAGLAWAEREGCPITAGRNLSGLAALARDAGEDQQAASLTDRALRIFSDESAELYRMRAHTHTDV